MLEFGILDDQVKNHIILNAYDVDPSIKDIQMLFDQERHKLLVYVELSFWSNLFKKEEILNNVYVRLHELLPEYKVRVIDDIELFKKALKMVIQP